MAPITLSSVRKTYPNGVDAVQGITLDIADGEFVVLVGPSGCGKSTLLRMVAGLETVTEGDILIDGARVNDDEPADRDIAMVFQNYALYPHMSVFDNLAYGLRNRGTPTAEIKSRVSETARILEIGHLLDRKPRQLSGGQRQRVAMGRAIVRNPRAFLFDEPLSNLDAKLRVQMRVEIRKLQREFGTTSIYVTHDQLEAMTLADRLVIMNAGRVEQIGAPIDLYRAPASTFVAGFIGAPGMNLVPADKLPRLPSLPFPPGGTIGIRPEDIGIAEPAEENSDAVSIPCRVAAIERIGAETLVHGVVEALGTQLIARVPGDVTAEPGTELTLVLPMAAIHVFDAETGQRVPSPIAN